MTTTVTLFSTMQLKKSIKTSSIQKIFTWRRGHYPRPEDFGVNRDSSSKTEGASRQNPSDTPDNEAADRTPQRRVISQKKAKTLIDLSSKGNESFWYEQALQDGEEARIVRIGGNSESDETDPTNTKNSTARKYLRPKRRPTP
ncbi:MAG: hypothetical protein R2838_15360 [Caldilineaceae bacterium]